MQMLLLNPRKRRAKKGARKVSRRARRSMTAKQLKFFGPRAHRSAPRRARRRTITMQANPAPRRSRRRSRRSLGAVRRFRRNPISRASVMTGLKSVVPTLTNAATGAAGAVAVDILMGQAGRILPASVMSRYTPAGGMNPAYYGAKAVLALGVGILGAKFLPGKAKMIAAKAAEGSLTVQGYEMLRAMVPASVMLGYYNPATVAARNGSGLGAYLPRNRGNAGGAMGRLRGSSAPSVVGVGNRSAEGYTL